MTAMDANVTPVAPLAPIIDEPVPKRGRRPMYSAAKPGNVSPPSVMSPSIWSLVICASSIASRAAWAIRPPTLIPGIVRRVGSSPIPMMAASPRKLTFLYLLLVSSHCGDQLNLGSFNHLLGSTESAPGTGASSTRRHFTSVHSGVTSSKTASTR